MQYTETTENTKIQETSFPKYFLENADLYRQINNRT